MTLLKSGHLSDLDERQRVDKFPLTESAKLRKSAVVTLVLLSRAKIGD